MGFPWPKKQPNPACGDCRHRKRLHTYLMIIGDNVGKCLKRGCRCTMFEEW